MGTTHVIDVEQKYDAEDATPLPPLQDLPGVDRVEEAAEHELEAKYFATDDLPLASVGYEPGVVDEGSDFLVSAGLGDDHAAVRVTDQHHGAIAVSDRRTARVHGLATPRSLHPGRAAVSHFLDG